MENLSREEFEERYFSRKFVYDFNYLQGALREWDEKIDTLGFLLMDYYSDERGILEC